MASLGFQYTTVGRVIDRVTRLTKFLDSSQHRDRYWGIRDHLVAVYEEYHDSYRFREVLERGITFTWTSTDQIDLSSVVCSDSDGVQLKDVDGNDTTGLYGWRQEPHSIKSSGQDWRWEMDTPEMIDNARDRYTQGNNSAQYKFQDESRGFLYAVEGDRLVVVRAVTSETITIAHYRNPTPITQQTAETTELEFPRQFLDLLVYRCISNEWLSNLLTTPESFKEQRRAMDKEHDRIQRLIEKREKELFDFQEIPTEILGRPAPSDLEMMYHAAEMQWETTVTNLDIINRIWK